MAEAYAKRLDGYSPASTSARIDSMTRGLSSRYVTPNQLESVGRTQQSALPSRTSSSTTNGMYHSLFSFEPFTASHFGKRSSGGEAPEVHGDARIERNLHGVRLVLAVLGDVADLDELRHLRHAAQLAVRRNVADAARDAAVFAEREVKPKADHRKMHLAVACGLGRKERCELRKGVAAVEVVGVDDRKGSVDDAARRTRRVRGAPRLRAACGDGIGRREVRNVLIAVVHRHQGLELATDLLLELRFEVPPNDEQPKPPRSASKTE